MSAGRARWFEKMLSWTPSRRQGPTRSPVVDRDQLRREQQASEIVRGIKRRLDDREKLAGRRAVVHPLYLEQLRRTADQPVRDPANRGPVDRRQTS